MRVLVTRPQPAASRTAERLRALGHEPVVAPLAYAVHDISTIAAGLRLPHAAMAVTSAEAIRALLAAATVPAGDLEAPLFAVGEATADAARQAGFRKVLVSGGDGYDLADLIDAEMSRGNARPPLLYLGGSPRSEGLERRLAERAIAFTVVDAYRMVRVPPDDTALADGLSQGRIDAVLLYSTQSAKRLFSFPLFIRDPGLLDDARMLCLSRKIAGAVQERYVPQVVIAGTPDEDSLFGLL